MEYPLVAKRLKEAMNEKNISAIELSKRSGVGKSAISHYVNGRYCPQNRNAVLIADVLGVNPTWIMGFDVEKHIPKSEIMRDNIILTQQELALIEMYRNKENDEQVRKIFELLAFYQYQYDKALEEEKGSEQDANS